jgi:hypothetical protein
MKTKINEVIAGSDLIAQALVQKRQNKIREGMNTGAIRLDTVNGISPYTDFPHEAPTPDLVFNDESWKDKIEKLDEKINEVNRIPAILTDILGDFD